MSDEQRDYDAQIWDRLASILQDLSRHGDWATERLSDIIEDLLESARKAIDDMLRGGRSPASVRALCAALDDIGPAAASVAALVALRHAIEAAAAEPVAATQVVVVSIGSTTLSSPDLPPETDITQDAFPEASGASPAADEAQAQQVQLEESIARLEAVSGVSGAAGAVAVELESSGPTVVVAVEVDLEPKPVPPDEAPPLHESIGTDADDVIRSGSRDQVLTGGAGEDTFVFGDTIGHDVITDLTEGDVIVFRSGYETLEEVLADARQEGDDVVIHVSQSDRITLRGIDLDDLAGYLLF